MFLICNTFFDPLPFIGILYILKIEGEEASRKFVKMYDNK